MLAKLASLQVEQAVCLIVEHVRPSDPPRLEASAYALHDGAHVRHLPSQSADRCGSGTLTLLLHTVHLVQSVGGGGQRMATVDGVAHVALVELPQPGAVGDASQLVLDIALSRHATYKTGHTSAELAVCCVAIVCCAVLWCGLMDDRTALDVLGIDVHVVELSDALRDDAPLGATLVPGLHPRHAFSW